MNEIKLTDTIEVVDAYGKRFEVYKYTEFIDNEEGLSSLQLANGGHLNFIDDATFQVVQTGEILKVLGKEERQ